MLRSIECLMRGQRSECYCRWVVVVVVKFTSKQALRRVHAANDGDSCNESKVQIAWEADSVEVHDEERK